MDISVALYMHAPTSQRCDSDDNILAPRATLSILRCFHGSSGDRMPFYRIRHRGEGQGPNKCRYANTFMQWHRIG